MGANRAFGAAGGYLADRTPGIAGTTGFALGATDAARDLGGLAPALVGRDLTHPATAAAVRANATTSAIHHFAEKDALRNLGTNYFGPGQAGERAFAGFAPTMVPWKALGDIAPSYVMTHGAPGR